MSNSREALKRSRVAATNAKETAGDAANESDDSGEEVVHG